MSVIAISALLSTCFPFALVVRGDVLRCWFETLDFWVSTISLEVGDLRLEDLGSPLCLESLSLGFRKFSLSLSHPRDWACW